jgi:NADPH:quinone reductase-like Zn-dependent oxidoreductase
MKAIVQTGYGSPRDVLDLQEVTAPIAGDGEVLVRVKAASVHPDVWHVVTGLPLMLRVMGSGIRQPKVRIPGSDAAGVVESVGAGVTSLHPGDEVFGETLHGHGWHNGGAFAQYVTVAADALGHKPPKLTFEQAAGIPSSGYIALRAVRSEGRVDAGQNVLVNGAGGGVGTYAIQIAKAAGAEVTGVDRGEKLDTILSIGADHALDYTVDDFTSGSAHGVR